MFDFVTSRSQVLVVIMHGSCMVTASWSAGHTRLRQAWHWAQLMIPIHILASFIFRHVTEIIALHSDKAESSVTFPCQHAFHQISVHMCAVTVAI